MNNSATFFIALKRGELGGYQHLHFPVNYCSGRKMNELIEMHQLPQQSCLVWGLNYPEFSTEQQICCLNNPAVLNSLVILQSIVEQSCWFSSLQLLDCFQSFLTSYFLKLGIISFVAALFPFRLSLYFHTGIVFTSPL